jgi:hypothetical protein
MARAHREIMVRTGPPRTRSKTESGAGWVTARARSPMRVHGHDGFKRAEAEMLKSVAS